ncbi:hypothetical protein V8B97DRAFT_2020130 [Scleroderma yunnanense]
MFSTMLESQKREEEYTNADFASVSDAWVNVLSDVINKDHYIKALQCDLIVLGCNVVWIVQFSSLYHEGFANTIVTGNQMSWFIDEKGQSIHFQFSNLFMMSNHALNFVFQAPTNKDISNKQFHEMDSQIIKDVEIVLEVPHSAQIVDSLLFTVIDPTLHLTWMKENWSSAEVFKVCNVMLEKMAKYHSHGLVILWKPSNSVQMFKQESVLYVTSICFPECTNFISCWAASSVPSECVFSSASETMTKCCNHISPILMEAIQMMKFFLKKEQLNFTKGWIDDIIKAIGEDEGDEIDDDPALF